MRVQTCYNLILYERIRSSPLRCPYSRITEDIRKGVNSLPNIKSAKKRVKVIAAKTLQNKMVKSQLRTTIKKYLAAVESGNKENAMAAYRAAVKKVDQAASRGIIHKNAAAHKKSRFTKLFNEMN